MRDLNYSTEVTDRHNVTVSTWQEPNSEGTEHWWARIRIDGVELAWESLGPVEEGDR